MWSKSFWASALERAVRAAAWAALAALSVPQAGGVVGVDVLSIGWQDALSLAAGAAVLSLLGSVAASRVGDSDSPSLVGGAPRPSPEAVRILSRHLDPKLTEAAREAVRKLGPGGLR